MRYIKSIFESIDSFSFEEAGNIDETYYYFFSDGQNEFRVEIDRKPEGEAEILYRVKEGEDWTFKVVQTNIFRLLKTIFDGIIPDFISKNDWCQMITIKGLGKGTEKDPLHQRTKVYYRYLQNNPIDGWELDRYGNEIYLDKIM
jgi:hypothetical protein